MIPRTRAAKGESRPATPRIVAAWLRPGTQILEIGFEHRQRITLSLDDLRIPAKPPVVWAEPTTEGGAIALVRGTGALEEVGAELLLAVADAGRLPEDLVRRREALGKRVGARARALRRARGLTQDAVARALGMAASNYSRLESGRHAPATDTLVKLASALGVSLQQLVRG